MLYFVGYRSGISKKTGKPYLIGYFLDKSEDENLTGFAMVEQYIAYPDFITSVPLNTPVELYYDKSGFMVGFKPLLGKTVSIDFSE